MDPNGAVDTRGSDHDDTIIATHSDHETRLEAVGRLAAGIAHELNTPIQYVGHNLTFIGESLDELRPVFEACLALAEGAGDASTHLQSLAAAVRAADLAYLMEELPPAVVQAREGVDKVGRLVSAMRDFTRPGLIDRHEVDLNALLDSTLTLTRNEWKYTADAVTQLDPALPPVEGHGVELGEVFLSIVVDAAQAIRDVTPRDAVDKGTITVVTRGCDGYAEVRVSDTGSRLPRGCRETVFKPFFSDGVVTRCTSHGLPRARTIVVDRHGGTLSLEPVEGGGMTFVVRLPYRPGTPLSEVIA